MKHARIFGAAISLPVLLMLLSACGGGGGGAAPAPPAAGTFTKTVDPGSGSGTLIPFGATSYTRSQHLYTSAQIRGSGRIAAVQLRRSLTLAAATCPNFSVRLGHTQLAALGASFASNVNTGRGSLRTVIDNQSFTVPAGEAGTWVDIPLQGAFDYNGIDNMVVEFEKTGACEVPVDGGPDGTNIRVSTSTPGATSGTVDGVRNAIRFAFAGGDDAVRYPNSVGDPFPLSLLGGGPPRVQMLHLAGNLNGSGPISGIAMISTEAPTDEAAAYTVNIRLGHTSLTALTETFAGNFNRGGAVSVATGAAFKIPAGVPAGTPIWLPLDGVFTYNGTDNLIVDIEVTGASTLTEWAMDDAVAGRRLVGAVGDAKAFPLPGAYHTVFRFNGGTMDVNTTTGMSAGIPDGVPFLEANGKRQWLYLASELGSKGAIGKIACRSSADSSAESGLSYTVVLSHTTATSLGTNFADNLAAPVAVFNDTFSIPAALKGDWFEIPLSTPFAYNGKDNLVVQIEGSGGTPGNAGCVVDAFSEIRYASRWLGNSSSGTSDGAVLNALLDMRFTLQ